jgi:trans-2-enoyl-CoA reductase
MNETNAIVIHEHGESHAVARLERVPLPRPGAGEVVVRVLRAPINPADLNVLEGKYPTRPALPGTPGVEGLGEIAETGQRVLLPHGFGSWREAGVCRRDELVEVPADLDVDQAAMVKINPATALRMLLDFAPLQPGDWLVQNAANSAVGRAVIGISRARGWRTINLVRRAELAAELSALGADLVLPDDEAAPAAIRAHIGPAPVRLALNAVGGESALRLANVLADGGTHVTYGAMGRQPVRLPNGLLIFKDIRFRGFWVTRWYAQADAAAKRAMFEELFAHIRSGAVHAPVEKIYPLTEITAALRHAAQPGRSGKILLAP